jgi:hypothetical protein
MITVINVANSRRSGGRKLGVVQWGRNEPRILGTLAFIIGTSAPVAS